MKLTPDSKQLQFHLNNAIATAFFKHFAIKLAETPKAADIPSLVKNLDASARTPILKEQADLTVFPEYLTTDLNLNLAINKFIEEN